MCRRTSGATSGATDQQLVAGSRDYYEVRTYAGREPALRITARMRSPARPIAGRAARKTGREPPGRHASAGPLHRTLGTATCDQALWNGLTFTATSAVRARWSTRGRSMGTRSATAWRDRSSGSAATANQLHWHGPCCRDRLHPEVWHPTRRQGDERDLGSVHIRLRSGAAPAISFLAGNVTIDGMLLVEGNLTIRGNPTRSSRPARTAGLYVSGNLIVEQVDASAD